MSERTRHKRIRLPGYDYTQPNAYVFTVVTRGRECCLGFVVGFEFHPSPAGEIVLDAWHNLPKKFLSISLDAFVVMPNHIHGIVFLGANPAVQEGIAINGAATGESVALPFMATSPTTESSRSGPHTPNRQRLTPPSRDPVAPALGEIIRSLKAASTTQIRKQVDSTFAWQPNYWDRIIRSDAELGRYRTYMVNNRARWEEDKEYLKGDW
ncbi:transposase [soil metagenome]